MKRLLFALLAVAGVAGAQQQGQTQGSPLRLTPRQQANVELTVYLVIGSPQPQQNGGKNDDVPADLTSTLQQLHGVFAFKSYKMMDVITLRARAGRGGSEVAGDLPDFSHYDFRFNYATVTPETPRTVRIDGLRLEITRRARAARGENGPDVVALVSTDIDIKEGQKTVVGKSAVNGTDALFLVIVPKVTE